MNLSKLFGNAILELIIIIGTLKRSRHFKPKDLPKEESDELDKVIRQSEELLETYKASLLMSDVDRYNAIFTTATISPLKKNVNDFCNEWSKFVTNIQDPIDVIANNPNWLNIAGIDISKTYGEDK